MKHHPLASCEVCPIQKSNRGVFRGSINTEADYFFVSGAPTVQNIRTNQILSKQVKILLRPPSTSISGVPAFFCRPPNGFEITDEVINACKPAVMHEIDLAEGKIILLGKHAVNQVLGLKPKQAYGRFHKNGRIFALRHPVEILMWPTGSKAYLEDINRAFQDHQRYPPQIEAIVPTTINELKSALKSIGNPEVIAFDFETSGLAWTTDVPLNLGICWDDSGRTLIIPGDHPESPKNLLAVKGAIKVLNNWLKNIPTRVAHNSKFDEHFAENIGLELTATDDSLLLHFAADEEGPHGLKALARRYFDADDYEQILEQYLPKKGASYSNIPWDILNTYLGLDVYYTWVIFQHLKSLAVSEEVLDRPYRATLMRLNRSAYKMERRGFKVDREYLSQVSWFLEEQLQDIQKEMNRIVGDEVNPRSPQQMSEIIYEFLGVPYAPKPVFQNGKLLKKTSVSQPALDHLAKYNERGVLIEYSDPFVDALFRYRRRFKILSSYVIPLLAGSRADGRVHANIQLFAAVTGRISIVDPALQTIPRSTSDMFGALLRAAFIPSPGMLLIDADYSQAELRVWAALTGDPFLLDTYNNDRDLHSSTAEAIFGSEWTKEQRVAAKNVNFEYVFGGGGMFNLMQKGYSERAAQDFMRRYNEVLTVVEDWRARQVEFMQSHGYIESIFGYRRRFPIITRNNLDDAKKASWNQPVQNVASTINLLAADELIQEHEMAVMLPVHDNLVAEVPEDDAEADLKLMMEVQEKVGAECLPAVKWKSDGEILTRWSEPPQSFTDWLESKNV